MYAPHQTALGKIQYHIYNLTEITEYYQACFRLLQDEYKHTCYSK